MSRDDDVKQAIGQVARLGGFNIKRMATTDDLKDRTITITITRTSDGWHQERLAFDDVPVQREHSELNDLEPEPGLLVTAEADGRVVALVDPSDLTERPMEEPKAERATEEPAPAPEPTEPSEPPATPVEEPAEQPQETSPQLSEPEDSPVEHHLVGELAATARKRR